MTLPHQSLWTGGCMSLRTTLNTMTITKYSAAARKNTDPHIIQPVAWALY